MAPAVGDALDSLRHRGPDGEGRRGCSVAGGSWELFHTRLAIVDTSDAGRQPMADEDGRLVMVFNGEIYNSPDLRRLCEARGHRFTSTMDGEVILHLWEMEGPAALARLNGIFAVAVADTVTGEVTLARDPLGVKPLLYSTDAAGSLWFASELPALRAMDAPFGESDTVALAQFLSFLWIPDPRTPYSSVRSLPPGTMLRWSSDGIDVRAYGEPLVPAADPRPMAFSVAVGELRERFREAAQRQLLADVPIGLMASGGVDSGLIWWATSGDLEQAYSIEWPGAADFEGLSDDRRAVGELHARFGTPVSFLPGGEAGEGLPTSGDLFADPAYHLTRLIAAQSRADGIKVLLSGQGGDEVFAGYRRHSVAPVVGRVRLGRAADAANQVFQRLPSRRLGSEYVARLGRALAERDPLSAYMQMCTYSTAEERADALGCTAAEVGDEVVWQRHREVFDRLPPGLSFLRKVMALDLAVYLPGLGLAYVDRAGMEFGVEIRVPWLDLELVRWAFTLPDDVLLRRGKGKRVSKELAASTLSPWIANRPKRGFSAPAGAVGNGQGNRGQRGFRQGVYFERARAMLSEHLVGGAV